MTLSFLYHLCRGRSCLLVDLTLSGRAHFKEVGGVYHGHLEYGPTDLYTMDEISRSYVKGANKHGNKRVAELILRDNDNDAPVERTTVEEGAGSIPAI